MPAQQFSNNAQTTLTAQCNPADASIAVASAAAFPANTPYTVLIDTEYLLVTSGAGTTTWGVTRAQEGGSAGTWRAGGNPALLNARTPLVTALPSPLLNTQFRIQSEGAFVAATDGSGHYTVTFPVAFATGLLSVVQSIAANAFGGGQLAM